MEPTDTLQVTKKRNTLANRINAVAGLLLLVGGLLAYRAAFQAYTETPTLLPLLLLLVAVGGFITAGVINRQLP